MSDLRARSVLHWANVGALTNSNADNWSQATGQTAIMTLKYETAYPKCLVVDEGLGQLLIGVGVPPSKRNFFEKI